MVKRSRVALAFATLASVAVGCQLVASIEDVHYDPSDAQPSEALAEVGDTSDSSVLDAADSSAVDTGDSTTLDTADTKDTTVTDSDASVPEAETGPAPCPSKAGTTAMVRVPSSKGSYCIDVNEVTITQMELYDGLTLTAPPGLPARCAGIWKRWYRRFAVGTDPPVVADEPAINANYCQAFAYCKWAGKRLCRALDTSGPAAPINSELFWACSNAGASTRPYGATYAPKSCDVESGRSTPASIGLAPKCHGTSTPYDKVFNLIGSAEEWSDECVDPTPPAKPKCTARGGYFGNSSTDALCAQTVTYNVDSEFASLGFRCCAD
ncbi:MAG: SUMF1/EgtB/PvdO family nonheme iron enzyme [Myxococcales bacterium]|nr:SUMF1/EgtB/PvdO family nonheme iron enzyme [Myxococcales bacterium]